MGRDRESAIMLSDKVRFYKDFTAALIRITYADICHKVQAFEHRLTYRQSPSAKNVVVVGGSFSGAFLAQRLASTLPTGYRVVLIEKNSHFNYVFNFPRYSVLRGREHLAFIPYTNLARNAPPGIFHHVQDTVTQIEGDRIQLKSGNALSFDYLAIATGTSRGPPARLSSSAKADACTELQRAQQSLSAAQKIAVIGGGPVGVQLATDIKSVYPTKCVSLIHSHDRLLPSFGQRVQDYATKEVKDMGVDVILQARPTILKQLTAEPEANSIRLRFENGREEDFDLVIPCIGQRPNSSFVRSLAPESISMSSGRLLVKPTLQLAGERYPNIFALGDVAETLGPKMARAGISQAEVVCKNIVSMIKRRERLKEYVPDPLEGALKLSLGIKRWVISYTKSNGREILFDGEDKSVDMDAAQTWKQLGEDIETATAQDKETGVMRESLSDKAPKE
ncbi:hypothetical protein A1O1_04770 [Capronia coronata CBS 617.96]|uniref:FAD/NAD(P)-binding domain-containing protein n=1 Tax=Capronia coronata CBS 617.96 TaxID=1182541 RepID=W9Y5R9_9EURO|nr:uncharacterized protein A1O1_04770 [Capronia coronata CBS 617.96]EXJ87843.1 hypothetical protein A1O1_04770 [Capronia coronata CBS 617.96]